MIERTPDRLGLWPERLTADTAYGSAAEMLNWLVHERGIEPQIPVFDSSKREDEFLSRSDFSCDHAADAYTRRAGERLRQHRKTCQTPLADENGTLRCRAGKFDCEAFVLKTRRRPKAPARKLLRSAHEGARDMARHSARTDARPS